MTTNVLRVGGLVLALTTVTGCGNGDSREPVHRELEDLGLVTGNDGRAFSRSFEALRQPASDVFGKPILCDLESRLES